MRMRYSPVQPFFCLWVFLAAMLCVTFTTAQAADRDRIRAFLSVTGFDVALDSIALSAGAAPQMLGLDAEAFGDSWERTTEEVFDTDIMRGLALDILENTLTDDLLNHAAAFYASDLGQRLVQVENASHMVEDDAAKQAEGRKILADLMAEEAPRAKLLQRMSEAIDSGGSSVRALQEIQYRFLLAASAAGVIDLRTDADGLRAMLESQEPEMRRLIQMSSMAGAAYTYRDFTDAEIDAYVEALEDPRMAEVYVLLNAVQYEVMANRFEVLAARMAELHPGQDI